MKKLLAALAATILILSATGCESTNPTPTGPIIKETTSTTTLIESTNIYEIYKNGFNYSYRIFNKNGDIIIEKENTTRCPHFTMLTDSLLEVKCQTGTGQSTNWVYYYDYKNDIVSETFYYVLSSSNNLVAHVNLNDNGKPILIIQDIYNTNNYYLEITEFENSLSIPCTEPIQSVTFSNDGKSIVVVYLSGKSCTKMTQTFELY